MSQFQKTLFLFFSTLFLSHPLHDLHSLRMDRLSFFESIFGTKKATLFVLLFMKVFNENYRIRVIILPLKDPCQVGAKRLRFVSYF